MAGMDLLINTFGTRIRSRGERIVLKLPKSKSVQEYPVRLLEKSRTMGHCTPRYATASSPLDPHLAYSIARVSRITVTLI